MNPVKAAAKGAALFFIGYQMVMASGLAASILDWIDHTPLYLALLGGVGLGAVINGLYRMIVALEVAFKTKAVDDSEESSEEK